MNERIKELLEQAGVKYVTMPKDTVYEKFAELIVRECAGIVKYYHSRNESVTPGQILQHFKVKE